MLRRSILFMIVGLLFLSSQLIADDNPLGWKVSKDTLDNGLKVVVLEDHSTPSVSVHVWYHVGSKNERPGITGISHMVEHMMFKGTDEVGPEEHARIVQAHGGLSNAFTHYDMTAYHESLGAKDLELALKLEADRMRDLAIDSTELASELQVVAEERRTRIDNSPFGPVNEQLFNQAYNAHPYNWTVIGFMSDIQAYSVDKLRRYYDTYYKPNNATLVVVGDVKAKDVFKLADKHFSPVPRSKYPVYRPTTEEPEQMGERRAKVHKIAQIPGFFAGYKACEAGHEDSYALDILSRILSGGESSRAYKRLVYDEQICLAAGGGMMALEDPGMFFLYAIMQSPDKDTKDAEEMLYEELEKFKTEPLTERELQKAKNQIEAEKWMQLQSNENKAFAIGYYETIFDDYTLMFDEIDKYMAVTAEDVMEVAKKYFDERKRTVVTLVPESSAGAMEIGF